jgi:hypothetical protein|tara:strand:+ start:3346 stop:4089 length:744 start_codon:yes stop_codon:yes gene_type:complete
MSNSNTQLDLFHGVVLTTEQEQEIATWIEKQAKRAVASNDEVNRIMLMLDRAGFVQNEDYKTNFEIFKVTKEVSFGYSYNNTNYEHEVTYMNAVGGVSLITNCIHEGEIKTRNASVDRDGDKLMCTAVTEQYRYYKPSSLLTKLKEYNDRKINELERNGKQKIAMNKIIAKYKKLYPKAVVYSSTDYRRGDYTSFPIVKVKFESGSEVSFTLGYSGELDKERFHKKYDAVSETTEVLLERFSNQKAK